MDQHEIQNSILRELRTIRKQAELTQAELAKKLNKPQSYVAKYEGGTRKIELSELFTICSACETSATQFCNKIERQTKGKR